MSEITKKEFASLIKWTCVIIIAAFAYSKVAPIYDFSKNGGHAYRANKVTGLVEYSYPEEGRWVSAIES